MSEENKEDSQKPIVEEQKPESPKEEILDSKNEEPIQENKTEEKEEKEEDKSKEKDKPKEEPKIEEKLNEETKIKVDLNDEPNIKADLNENKIEENNALVEQSKNEVDIKSPEENKEIFKNIKRQNFLILSFAYQMRKGKIKSPTKPPIEPTFIFIPASKKDKINKI